MIKYRHKSEEVNPNVASLLRAEATDYAAARQLLEEAWQRLGARRERLIELATELLDVLTKN